MEKNQIFCLIGFMGLSLFSPSTFAEYSKDYIGEITYYEAEDYDTFVHLARDYNLGFVEMRAANPGVDPWVPGQGTDLILPTRHLLPDAPREGIVINLAEMRLYSFVGVDKEVGQPVSYALGIGRDGLETPLGQTKVVRKKEGPAWYPTDRMKAEDPELPDVVLPGPENPLGSHALYLGWPTYAIHGTNRPFGIGRRISSGCIRMYPEHIPKLFENVPVGTTVTVVDQPVKAGWVGNKFYVEAHPDVQQAVKVEETGFVDSSEASNEDIALIMRAAGAHADSIRWTAVRKAINERRGYPVYVGRRPFGSSVNAQSDFDDMDIEEIKEKIMPEEKADVDQDSDDQDSVASVEIDRAQELGEAAFRFNN